MALVKMTKMKLMKMMGAGRVSLQRGFGMLGLASLVAVLAMLTAAVAIASMRSSAGSIRGVQRLQVQAAAEGAAVLLATGDAASSGTVEVGECVVTLAPEDAVGNAGGESEAVVTTGSRVVRMKVELPVNGRVIYGEDYRVTLADGSAAGEAVVAVVEVVR